MSEDVNLSLAQALISQVKDKNKIAKLLTPLEKEFAEPYQRGFDEGIAYAERNLDEVFEELRRK